MEVDTNKFKNNISKIKKYIGNKEIMPIIKASAYGTYLNTNLDILNMFNIVAVALVDEAVKIRNLGYEKEIFVLNQPYIDDIEDILKYDITIGLSDESFLDYLVKNNIKMNVHLEIETGMNRTGISISNLDNFILKLKKSNINVEGVYTHFSNAEDDYQYTNSQIDKFKIALNKLKEFNLKYIHTSASSGLLNFNDGVSNLVRPGIIIYGYEPFDGAFDKIKLEPVAKLKSKITFIHDILEGESVGYGRRYKANKKTKIATVPIGYADGIRKELFNKGEVIINNTKCPIIGSICMDNIMVDISNIDAKVGDDVYIFDNNLIKVDDIASMCHTINYEILCDISARVPRIFI